jgi:hypothetical protein
MTRLAQALCRKKKAHPQDSGHLAHNENQALPAASRSSRRFINGISYLSPIYRALALARQRNCPIVQQCAGLALRAARRGPPQ